MDTTKWVKRCMPGRGSSGTVFLASPLKQIDQDSKLIAVKSVVMKFSSSLVEEGKFLRELHGCPEIISFLGYDISLENGKYVHNLLLEYAPGGTLRDLIKNSLRGKLPEYEVSWYTYMLLLGLDRIHQQGIVHCDIKPENILVFPSQEVGGAKHVKIMGFGLAKRAGSVCAEKISTNNGRWNKHRGTPLYSSPESVLFGQHEAPMDIWSLGCTVMEMLTGKLGYWSTSSSSPSRNLEDDDLLQQIAFEEELPEIPENISDDAKDFLIRCLIRDPRERWTAERLLEHPFIVENLKFGYELRRAETVVTNPITNCSKWWSGTSLFSDWLAPSNSSTHILLGNGKLGIKVAFLGQALPYGPYLHSGLITDC